MYNSNRSKENIKKDSVMTYIQPGIHENVKLIGIKVGKGQTNSFIEFKFDKDGKTASHTEWAPSRRDDPSLSKEENDARFLAKCDNQFERIKEILVCYHDPEKLVFSGDSFESLQNWVEKVLNAADLSKLLRVKFICNNAGYSALPQYSKYTFIEPMDVAESKVVELSFDVFTKPAPQVKADVESVVNENPFGNTSTVNPPMEEMPFI